MAGQEVNTLGNNLLANNIEYPPVQSVNQNSPVKTPRRSQEAISACRDPDNSTNIKNLVDGLSLDLMAKIVIEITKRLKEVEPEKSGSETKFFDQVASAIQRCMKEKKTLWY